MAICLSAAVGGLPLLLAGHRAILDSEQVRAEQECDGFDVDSVEWCRGDERLDLSLRPDHLERLVEVTVERAPAFLQSLFWRGPPAA